jgi:hypothetical protein
MFHEEPDPLTSALLSGRYRVVATLDLIVGILVDPPLEKKLMIAISASPEPDSCFCLSEL